MENVPAFRGKGTQSIEQAVSQYAGQKASALLEKYGEQQPYGAGIAQLEQGGQKRRAVQQIENVPKSKAQRRSALLASAPAGAEQ